MKRGLILLLAVILCLGLLACNKPVEFNINFIVDGSLYDTVSTTNKENITMPKNPAKEGYAFDGWYWDNGKWEKPFTVNSLLDAPLSSDMSVYAKWTHLVHQEVVDEAVAPTCTDTGLTEGKHCSVCGEVFVAQTTVAALGHTEVIDEVVAPTCTESGLTEGKHCSVCNEVLVAQTVVDALGHTEVVDNAVSPTCTETGLTEGKHCSVCGEVFVAQNTVAATGHSYGEWYVTVQPTESLNGTKRRDCANCDAFETDLIAKLTHDHSRWDKITLSPVAPTCTTAGLTEGKVCSGCNEILVAQTVIAALGHSAMIDEAVAPTCTKTGLTEGKHCSVCNTTLVAQITVNALGHTEIVDEAVDPTCTETGLTEGKHCSACDEVLVAQTVVDALGHTEVVDKAVDPTCIATGLTEGKHCSECGYIFVAQKNVNELGHNYISHMAQEATCTTIGCEAYQTCSRCNYTTYVEIPALGHDYINHEAKMPYCAEIGWDEYQTCSRCLYNSYVELPIEGYSHITANGYCIGCGLPESTSGLEFCLNSDGKTYTVTGIGTCTETNIVIGVYKNKSVKVIGDSAFRECSWLTSVTIGNSVTGIGHSAFYDCTNLTSITIPDSVTYIYYYAFVNCSSLTNVYITDIAKWCRVFLDIGSASPFKYAKNLYLNGERVTDLVIPEGVTSIGQNAFNYCTFITSITFEGTVEQWNAIEKGYGWNFDIPVKKVICSDGVVTL